MLVGWKQYAANTEEQQQNYLGHVQKNTYNKIIYEKESLWTNVSLVFSRALCLLHVS